VPSPRRWKIQDFQAQNVFEIKGRKPPTDRLKVPCSTDLPKATSQNILNFLPNKLSTFAKLSSITLD